MKSSELLRKLQRAGWVVDRQTGSHMMMTHPTLPGQLVVPNHGSQEVGTGLANKLLKAAGLK